MYVAEWSKICFPNFNPRIVVLKPGVAYSLESEVKRVLLDLYNTKHLPRSRLRVKRVHCSLEQIRKYILWTVAGIIVIITWDPAFDRLILYLRSKIEYWIHKGNWRGVSSNDMKYLDYITILHTDWLLRFVGSCRRNFINKFS